MLTTNCYQVKPFSQRIRTFFTVEQGLPSDKTTCAAFDGRGILWVGTEKGLAFLDGDSFKRLSLKGTKCAITLLFCAEDGSVYAGAENFLYLIKNGKVKETFPIDGTPVDMAYDGDGTLWVLTPDFLFCIIDGELNRYTHIEEGSCTSIAAFGSKNVYLANPMMLLGLHGKRPRLAGILPETSNMPAGRVQTMTADKWGHMWIGTDKGVCIYDARSRWMSWKEIDTLTQGDIRKIIIGKDGTRYIGTANGIIIQGGVKESHLLSKRWLPDDCVTALAVSDDASDLCVCTDKGISIITTKTMTLKEKADYYQEITEKYHVRKDGFVMIRNLERLGDITSGAVEISDNDGLWTGHYACAQSFRYAVTKDKEALQLARRSINAMLELTRITGIDGFTARAYRRENEQGFGDGNPEWHLVTDSKGKLEWKCETSSDEMMGHFYTYAIYFDLCADNNETAEIAEACQKIVDHILSHDYHLCDYDGLPTTWANWNPQDLNYNDQLFWEKGVNSMEMLCMLMTVYHMTGIEKYRDEYKELVTKHDYALNCVQHKIHDNHVNHIDDHLGFLAVTALLRYEEDPELRQYFLLGLRHHWNNQRVERFPLWNLLYGALTGEHCDIENAVKSLQELPLDLIHWKTINSVRPDLDWDEGQELYGGGRQLKQPLPYDEKPIGKSDDNPFVADGGNDMRAEDGSVFLHPYWLGRYFGLFSEE